MASGSRSRSRGRGKSSKSGKAADTAPAVVRVCASPASAAVCRDRAALHFPTPRMATALRAPRLHCSPPTHTTGHSICTPHFHEGLPQGEAHVHRPGEPKAALLPLPATWPPCCNCTPRPPTPQSLSLASRAHNLHSPRATELDGSSVDFDFGAGAWYALVFAVVLAAVACAVQSYYPHLQHASCEDSCKLGYPSLDSAAALWAYAQEWWALHGSPADMTLMAGAGAVAGMVYGGFVAEPLH